MEASSTHRLLLFFALACCFVAPVNGLAQGTGSASLACRLVDGATSSPVPYANLYVPAVGTGIVSDADGFLKLSPSLQDADPATQVTVSCIGYDNLVLELGRLQAAAAGCQIEISPQAYALAEAEVVDRAYGKKARQLGFRRENGSVQSGYSSEQSSVGTELGNIMKTDKDWLLERVGFNMRLDTATLFELNVYAYADKLPQNQLNTKRVLVSVPADPEQSRSALLDLRDFRISGSGDFLVTLEVIGAAAPVDRITIGDGARLAEVLSEDAEQVLAVAPTFHSAISLRGKKRITRYRKADGVWSKPPAGIVIGMWCEVREAK